MRAEKDYTKDEFKQQFGRSKRENKKFCNLSLGENGEENDVCKQRREENQGKENAEEIGQKEISCKGNRGFTVP